MKFIKKEDKIRFLWKIELLFARESVDNLVIFYL